MYLGVMIAKPKEDRGIETVRRTLSSFQQGLGDRVVIDGDDIHFQFISNGDWREEIVDLCLSCLEVLVVYEPLLNTRGQPVDEVLFPTIKEEDPPEVIRYLAFRLKQAQEKSKAKAAAQRARKV